MKFSELTKYVASKEPNWKEVRRIMNEEVDLQNKYYEQCADESLMRFLEFENFVRLVANGKRSDGTYNLCREALEQKAKELLK